MKGIAVSEKEYYDKKLEIARSLLPAMVNKVTEEYLVDKRKRASLLFNCVSISEDLLTEMGIRIEKPPKLLGGDSAKKPQKTQSKPNLPVNRTVNPTIRDKREESSTSKTTILNQSDKTEDIGNKTAIRKLSEMLPDGTED